MSDYCTVAKVEKWFPGVTFSTSTKITSAEVGELITRHSAKVDGRLASKYTTPITGTTSLLIVEEVTELLTVADVEDILMTGLGKEGEKADNATDNIRARANAMIDKIEEGELDLPDATKVSSPADFYNYNRSNNISAKIKKETTQW